METVVESHSGAARFFQLETIAFYVTCVIIFNAAGQARGFARPVFSNMETFMLTTPPIRALLALSLILTATSGLVSAPRARWRTATEQELRRIIPARAPVIKENIETEMRTASGITDGRGHFIAGVVMITAGYSAQEKYSHFFIIQTALKVGDTVLEPGEYVFGSRRVDNDTLRVSFYRASSGETAAEADAHVNRKSAMVRSLLITAPVDGRATIQIGRFLLDYRIA